MPTNTTIDIPPAANKTVDPGTITFDVSSACTVCFGTANPSGSFPDLEGNTWNWAGGSTQGPYVADTANATLPYNTSNQGNPCDPEGLTDTGHTITVGSGLLTARTRTKAKAPSKAKPKTKAKAKAKARAVSKAKPAPKTKAKSKTKKAAPKKKAKTRVKAKPKAKKGGKSKR